MLFYLHLYLAFLSQHFKRLLEYRANFIIGASSTVLVQGANLLAIWVVMRQIPTLRGWSLNEVFLVYGVLTVSLSLNQMFADNLWTLGNQYIRTGTFDYLLIRPINPLFHLLANRFNHVGIGDFIVGVTLIIRASLELELEWSAPKLIFLMVAILSGGVIFISLNLITCVSAFWIIDSVPVTRVVFDTHHFVRYPLSIYPRTIQLVMTWFIPYAFASYYPAATLLERSTSWLPLASPFVALVWAFLAYRIWLFGLRNYRSTGS